MQLSCGDTRLQRLSRRQQVLLTSELGEGARPHSIRERPLRIACSARAHLRGVPITSAPAWGVKLTSFAATGPLRSIFSKITVAV